MTEKKRLTTNGGAPVPDNQNVLTAGPRGPMLLQDDQDTPDRRRGMPSGDSRFVGATQAGPGPALPPVAGFESAPEGAPSGAPRLPNPEETTEPAVNVGSPGAVPEQGQPLYRLRIPKIKVNNIVVFGSSDGALSKAPGHIEGTPFPWHGGNSAIAAHRDYFFWRLGELEIGDEVRVESELGALVYKITQTRVVHESNVGVLSPTGQDQITLITCWPLIFLGDTPDRLVITAVLQ